MGTLTLQGGGGRRLLPSLGRGGRERDGRRVSVCFPRLFDVLVVTRPPSGPLPEARRAGVAGTAAQVAALGLLRAACRAACRAVLLQRADRCADRQRCLAAATRRCAGPGAGARARGRRRRWERLRRVQVDADPPQEAAEHATITAGPA